MWSIDNQTPFAAERGFCRDRDGGEIWLVVVRATFTIASDGSTHCAQEQSLATQAPEYIAEPGRSSLRCDSDFVRTKCTTDVLLYGHAYAPGARPVTQLEAAFSVGDVSKRLRVVGDRVFTRQAVGVAPGTPKPFLKMPLTYERAYGGRDPQQPNAWLTGNPLGVGYALQSSSLVGRPAPNIEAPSDSGVQWKGPTGVLPIAPEWTPRVHLAGTYDAAWQAAKSPCVPDDLDDRFYQSAPLDQQSAQFLRGNERVGLYNLTPGGSLGFDLPRIALGFETEFRDYSTQHPGRLHSVILEPDVPRVILVWHAALRCHGKLEQLLGTTVTQKAILQRGAAA